MARVDVAGTSTPRLQTDPGFHTAIFGRYTRCYCRLWRTPGYLFLSPRRFLMAIGVSTPAEQSDTMGMIEVYGLKGSSARDTLIKSRSRLPAAGLPPLSMPWRGRHVSAVLVPVVLVAAASSIPSLRKVKAERRHINGSSSTPWGLIARDDDSMASSLLL